MESTQSGWWRRHGWTLAILLSAFGLTFAVRTIWEYPVIAQWGPLFTYAGGSDSYYHSRVMSYIILNHRNLIVDPMLRFPIGAVNPREPLFDWMNALLGMLFAPAFGGNAVTAGAWFLDLQAPLWAALGVFPIYLIGREVSGRRMGLIAALIYPFLSANIDSSTFGYANYLTFYTFFVLVVVYAYLLYGEGGRHATVHRKLREAQPVHPRHPRLPTDRTHCREVERLHGCLPGGARPGVAGLHVRRGRDRRRRPHRDAGRADPEGRLVRPLLLDVDRRAGRLPDGRTLLLRSGRPAAILRRSDPPVLRNVGHPPSVPPDAGHTLGLLDPGADPVRRRCGDPPQGGLPPVLHRRDHGARLLRQEPRLLDDRGSPGTVHRFARDRLRGHHVLPRVRGRCPVRVPPGPAPVQAVPPRLPRLRHSLDLPPHLGVEVLRYRFAGVRSPFRRSGPSRPRRGGLPRPPTDGGLAHRHAEPRGRVPQGVQSEARPRPGPGRRDLAPERLDIDRRGDPRATRRARSPTRSTTPSLRG